MKNQAHYCARRERRRCFGLRRSGEMAGGGKHLACLFVATAVCYALGGAAAGLTSTAEAGGRADAAQIKPYSMNPSYWEYHGSRPINHVKCYHFNWLIGDDFSRDRASPTDAEAGAKFWRAVFAGVASIRFHRHTPTRPGGLREGFGLAPEGQRHLRSMREFIDAIHIFSMNPRNDLLSERVENEAYCQAEPKRQYAVFFTGAGDGRARIELAPSEDPWQLRWLDIATSHWGQKTTVSRRPHVEDARQRALGRCADCGQPVTRILLL